ncbi:MAG: hypothetical protein KZQ88_04410 [Candidatus Thiodiazotropha sp. (ex Dulcina madagascariensis)]|nr:hypothetical protein [Candidatus Thiodiazotropha sp. (ex Dulcina madagascariensis)]MCU7924850.1 hypothetical protein [Candidatus Thiodiazotropha sp. (ex Dulcina madagascariensis)]
MELSLFGGLQLIDDTGNTVDLRARKTKALLRDGIYASLLSSHRRALHHRAAVWYRERDTALHARHLDLAGDEGAAAAYLRAA